MGKDEDLTLQECFEQEVNNYLKLDRLDEFPTTIQVESTDLPNLERWKAK